MAGILNIKIKAKFPISERELHQEIDNRLDMDRVLEQMFKAGYWWNKNKQCYEIK